MNCYFLSTLSRKFYIFSGVMVELACDTSIFIHFLHDTDIYQCTFFHLMSYAFHLMSILMKQLIVILIYTRGISSPLAHAVPFYFSFRGYSFEAFSNGALSR